MQRELGGRELPASGSRRPEGYAQEIGRRLTVLEPLGNDTERERLYPGEYLAPGLAVGHNAREIGDFTNPAPVVLLLEVDCVVHLDAHILNVSWLSCRVECAVEIDA